MTAAFRASPGAVARAAAAALLSAMVSSCPYVPLGDSVVFSDPGPGATISFGGSAARYGEAYPVPEGSTVTFGWTARLADRYRWLYCVVSPEAELNQRVSGSASEGTASFVKSAYVMTVDVIVREYANSSLIASADGLALAWTRNDAIIGTPGSYRSLAPALLAADSTAWEERTLRPAEGGILTPAAWRADGKLVARIGDSHFAVEASTGDRSPVGSAADGFSVVSPEGRYLASPALSWYDSQDGRRASLRAPGDHAVTLLAVSANAVLGIMGGAGADEPFIWNPAAGTALKLAAVPYGSVVGAAIVPEGAASGQGDAVLVLSTGEIRRYSPDGGIPSVALLDEGLSASRIMVRGSAVYVEASGATSGAPFSALYEVTAGSGAPALEERFRADWAERIEPIQGGWAYLGNPSGMASRLYRDVVVAIDGSDPATITPDDATLLAD